MKTTRELATALPLLVMLIVPMTAVAQHGEPKRIRCEEVSFIRAMSEAPIVVIARNGEEKVLKESSGQALCDGYDWCPTGIVAEDGKAIKGDPGEKAYIIAEYRRHADDGRMDPTAAQGRAQGKRELFVVKPFPRKELRDKDGKDLLTEAARGRTLFLLVARYPLDYFSPIGEEDFAKLAKEFVDARAKEGEDERKKAFLDACLRNASSKSPIVSRDCLIELMSAKDAAAGFAAEIDVLVAERCSADGWRQAAFNPEADFRTRLLCEFSVGRSDRAGIDLMFLGARNALAMFPMSYGLQEVLARLEKLSGLGTGIDHSRGTVFKDRYREALARYQDWWAKVKETWK